MTPELLFHLSLGVLLVVLLGCSFTLGRRYERDRPDRPAEDVVAGLRPEGEGTLRGVRLAQLQGGRRWMLLVLKRRCGERLKLVTAAGEVVWLLVSETHRGTVKIGVEAPQSVDVQREENLPLAERYGASGSEGRG